MANSSRLVFPIRTASAASKPLDDGRIVQRDEILEDLRAAGGPLPLHAEDVLDGDDHPGKRARRSRPRASGPPHGPARAPAR